MAARWRAAQLCALAAGSQGYCPFFSNGERQDEVSAYFGRLESKLTPM
jgi:hypothetical protein